MSRSALWRQEGNVLEREREAAEAFEEALEDGRQRKSSSMPFWGNSDNDRTFHWHPVLLRNTIHSSYFVKCCRELKDWNTIIDEIYCEVKTMDTFASNAAGGSKQHQQSTPTTAFCLLLRLLTLRMTEHQISLTLKHPDSPYIRAIGFLYLRYVCPPERMVEWIEPYLLVDDEEGQEIKVDRTTIPLGKFVRRIFLHNDYFGATPLPRLPASVEAPVHTMVRHAECAAERGIQHYKNADRMQRFTSVGTTVMALYGDSETPATWYRAIVDRVLHRDDLTNRTYKYPRFIVTFPEYGNTETVRLGELDELQNRRDGEREQNGGKRGCNNNNDSHRRMDSRDSHNGARKQYGRGHSYRTHEHDRQQSLQHQPPHQPHQQHENEARHEAPRRQSVESTTTVVPKPVEKRQRTPAELAAIAEKRRKLAAKYG
jgi:pre-mRNA-splicing factor 38B